MNQFNPKRYVKPVRLVRTNEVGHRFHSRLYATHPKARNAWPHRPFCAKGLTSTMKASQPFSPFFAASAKNAIGRNQARATAQDKCLVQSTAAVRVVWVRRTGCELPKSTSLYKHFSAAGMQVWMLEAPNLVNLMIDPVTEFDLILFEYLSQTEGEMSRAVSQLRAGSRAPLLMLTAGVNAEESMDALRAGADAICTVNTPDEVILARCNALLRRWVANA